MSNKIIVFPGTFNPFHIGHFELIKKISKKYIILILISNNPNKKNVSFQKRFLQINEFLSLHKSNNVIVGINFGLTMEFLNCINTHTILRGYRNLNDKKYEKNLKKEYKKIKKELKVILIKNRSTQEISSTLLRKKY